MADKNDDKKDELTVVGPGADEDEQLQAGADGSARAGEDYEYLEGDEEGSGGADERIGRSEGGSEEESTPLTKEQKRRRKRREKYERDQRELDFLRSRNEALEREHSRRLAAIENRQTQTDVISIDGRITQAQSDVREAEGLFAQAVKSGDETAIAEALRVRDELRDGLRELQGTKQQTVRTAQARQTAATQPQPVDPRAAQRAQEWTQQHPWVQRGGEDARIASAVEAQLFSEGRIDPASDAYWDEVDRRLARRLPEHYRSRERDLDDEDDEESATRRPAQRVNGKGNGQRRAGGPTIKVGGRERPLKNGEVYIDEDRKQAMIEKGVWDDPVLRERQLQYYQKYDREAGRRPR